MTSAPCTSTFGLRGFPVRPGSNKSLAGKSLIAITMLFVAFGLLSVYSASSFVAQSEGLDDSHYLFQQLSRAGLGLLVLVVASQVDYRLGGHVDGRHRRQKTGSSS